MRWSGFASRPARSPVQSSRRFGSDNSPLQVHSHVRARPIEPLPACRPSSDFAWQWPRSAATTSESGQIAPVMVGNGLLVASRGGVGASSLEKHPRERGSRRISAAQSATVSSRHRGTASEQDYPDRPRSRCHQTRRQVSGPSRTAAQRACLAHLTALAEMPVGDSELLETQIGTKDSLLHAPSPPWCALSAGGTR